MISAALMAASGIYATYSAAGNTGALEPSGVDKVVALYRKNLDTSRNARSRIWPAVRPDVSAGGLRNHTT